MRRSSKTPVRLVAALLGLVATAAWSQPEPPPGRVLLFPEPNFRGDPLEVQSGAAIENLEFVRRGNIRWNDHISSVRIEGAVILVVYADAGFRGASTTLTRDAADLNALSLGDHNSNNWDNRISSLRVEPVPPAVPVFIRWERPAAERAIRAAYRDILGRDPDASGLKEYRDRLVRHGWTEDQLRDNLRQSDEFRHRDVDAIVRKVYRDVFGRDPDASGLANYTRALRHGMSEAELRADLKRSPEYATKSARESVTRAYREVLKRDPDHAGLANYTGQMLEHGWDENRVREALRQSEEYRKMPRH